MSIHGAVIQLPYRRSREISLLAAAREVALKLSAAPVVVQLSGCEPFAVSLDRAGGVSIVGTASGLSGTIDRGRVSGDFSPPHYAVLEDLLRAALVQRSTDPLGHCDSGFRLPGRAA